jgi:hypothetical protein
MPNSTLVLQAHLHNHELTPPPSNTYTQSGESFSLHLTLLSILYKGDAPYIRNVLDVSWMMMQLSMVRVQHTEAHTCL